MDAQMQQRRKSSFHIHGFFWMKLSGKPRANGRTGLAALLTPIYTNEKMFEPELVYYGNHNHIYYSGSDLLQGYCKELQYAWSKCKQCTWCSCVLSNQNHQLHFSQFLHQKCRSTKNKNENIESLWYDTLFIFYMSHFMVTVPLMQCRNNHCILGGWPVCSLVLCRDVANG